ncbi:Sensor histidine kinase RcsC [Candidatus Lokiarchaeum ossiferum]|uniref:Sensor histidine kinase RcsC n=1 Tax=Candidatus Lokiarchaeum ossiferum TaxID=2951803 RepID=A0ABY6HQ91_9ARCH|nr:Sensor histidine kinase RcsC [Candidatus Lokiarchaeum sp. B-35]
MQNNTEKNDSKYHQFFETIEDPIVVFQIDNDGLPSFFSEVNEAACNLLEYSRDELLCKKPQELDEKFKINTEWFVKELLETKYLRYEGNLIPKGNKSIPVEIHAKLINNYDPPLILSVIRDISDKIQFETAQMELFGAFSSKLKGIFQAFPDLYLKVDYEGKICDSYAEDYSKYQLENADNLNKRISEILPKESIFQILQGLKEVKRTNHLVTVEFQLNKTKEDQFFEARMVPYDQHHAIVLLRDISKRIQAVRALELEHEKKRRLESQLLQRQKMEAIGQLTGGIAHDFNNILMSIEMNADLATSILEQQNQKIDAINDLNEAVKRGKDLTNRLLTFSRKKPIKAELMNLNRGIEDIQKMLKWLIPNEIKLVLDLDPRIGLIRTDRIQFDQIIMNLAVNARDAIVEANSHREKRQILISTTIITLDHAIETKISFIPPGKYYVMNVQDTGIGMTTATLDRIFEPFFTTKEEGKGTGIGLATVYGIVKQNNAFIHVESKFGQGTNFQIYWQVEQDPKTRKNGKDNESVVF